jgi:hypothetical protein
MSSYAIPAAKFTNYYNKDGQAKHGSPFDHAAVARYVVIILLRFLTHL